nr:hypothetical protein [Tanacetum cinerariifolium]
HRKVAHRAEGNLHCRAPVDKYRRKHDAFYAERVVDQAFGITGFALVVAQLLLRHGDVGRVELPVHD